MDIILYGLIIFTNVESNLKGGGELNLLKMFWPPMNSINAYDKCRYNYYVYILKKGGGLSDAYVLEVLVKLKIIYCKIFPKNIFR